MNNVNVPLYSVIYASYAFPSPKRERVFVSPNPLQNVYRAMEEPGFVRIEEIVLVHQDDGDSQLIERIHQERVLDYIKSVLTRRDLTPCLEECSIEM